MAVGESSSEMSTVAVDAVPTAAPDPGLLRTKKKFSVLSIRLSFRIWTGIVFCVSPGPKVNSRNASVIHVLRRRAPKGLILHGQSIVRIALAIGDHGKHTEPPSSETV